jgi:hypothetical protein
MASPALASPLFSPDLAREVIYSPGGHNLLGYVSALEEECDSTVLLCEAHPQNVSSLEARFRPPAFVSTPRPEPGTSTAPHDSSHPAQGLPFSPYTASTNASELHRLWNHNQQLRKELASARALNAELVDQNFRLISKLDHLISSMGVLTARAQRTSKQRSRTKEIIESGLEKLSALKASYRSRPTSQILLPS